ncbi:uncharacterized protein [Syngnathus scovelli]|uniref:uncharacterized protein isoform X3 n=1 Tax=Syngnathus scovelli TaxID=161590 RepID=UPI0035CC56B8
MQRPKPLQASTCTLDTQAKMFALASPINVFSDKLQQTPFCRRCASATEEPHLLQKKVSKWPTCCPLKPGFMRRLQASKLRLERSPVLPCAFHWWCQRTSSLQHGSTGGAGDQEMRVMINVLSNILTGDQTHQNYALRTLTCLYFYYFSFSAAQLPVRVSSDSPPAGPRTSRCASPGESLQHLRLLFLVRDSSSDDKVPVAQSKLWQAEDEPSAVWCTIKYLLTAEARANVISKAT